MSVELTGGLRQEFETRPTSTGFELTGHGALRLLSVDFAEGWSHPSPLIDAAGVRLEHDTGVVATVVIRSGQRLRLEVTLESTMDEVVSVPGPTLRFEGERPAVAWLAGASGEIVLPSDAGPGLLTQRRGVTSPADMGRAHLFDSDPWLRPRQILSSAWTYETYEGDIFDVPVEQSWLPWSRYVPRGDSIEISMPDGRVSASDGVEVTEQEGEFLLTPPGGPAEAHVWTSSGQTTIDIGSFDSVAALRAQVVASRSGLNADAVCYLIARQLTESWTQEEMLDALDRALGGLLEQPTAWAACAASIASGLGLPLAGEAAEAATKVLGHPTADDVILLAMHGLAPVELTSGGWPIGDFGSLGLDAVARIGYGRISTDGPPLRGRDVAIAKIFAAGLGESERGLRVSAYAQAAENRLLTYLTANPNPEHLAWLSL